MLLDLRSLVEQTNASIAVNGVSAAGALGAASIIAAASALAGGNQASGQIGTAAAAGDPLTPPVQQSSGGGGTSLEDGPGRVIRFSRLYFEPQFLAPPPRALPRGEDQRFNSIDARAAVAGLSVRASIGSPRPQAAAVAHLRRRRGRFEPVQLGRVQPRTLRNRIRRRRDEELLLLTH